MIKEVVRVKIDEEYKESVFAKIEETAIKVASKHNKTLSEKELKKIRNLSLDQANVNVTHKANLKTLWVINIESSIPVVVEREKSLISLGGLIKAPEGSFYKMKSNFTWEVKKSNDGNGGVTKEEFEKQVLEMFLEDVETASFYGTLSMM